MNKHKIVGWNSLQDRKPAYALIANVDLVVIRYDEEVSVLYGRCAHRGALMSDGIAVSNAALQAIGCLGMRACNSNACPVGIATQREDLRSRLIFGEAAQRLHRFLGASVDLMSVLARACGHRHLSEFNLQDLTTFKSEMADLTGVEYGGVRARD